MATSVDYVIKVLGNTKDVDSKFGGLSKGAKVMSAAVVAAGAAAAVGLYKLGEMFDDVSETIRVGTGATGDALDGLVDSAKNVGKRVPAEFSKIAPTIADLNTRLGLSGETLETVASQYLEAGRILGTEVDIQGTTAAFTAFGIEGDKVSGAMDSLFQVSQATGVGMNELASGAQEASPALQMLGFSFEDSISLVGSFDKAGLESTKIMASMSKGLVELAEDGEEPAEAYRRVVGELQGFIDTGDTASALNLASDIFGTRGASQFIGAIESGVLNMEDLMAATGATGDTILGVGEETMDFAERWQVTMNTAMVALEPLATTVFNALGDALKDAMPTIQAFGDWLGENTWVINAVAIALGVLAGAVIAVNVAMWILNANPIVLLIVGIAVAVGVLIAAIVFLVQNWDEVVAFITKIWGEFVNWITGVIDGFVKGWNAAWARVGKIISDVWNNIVRWVSQAIQNVSNFIGSVLDGIRSAWEGVWNGIGSFLRGVWNNILGWIESGVNGAIDLINGMMGGIRDVAGFIGIEVGTISHVRIPRLAEGGVTTGPTLALVGDNPGGREVVQPLESAVAEMRRAYESGRRDGMNGTGVSVEQNIYPQPGMSEEQVGRIAGERITFALQGA